MKRLVLLLIAAFAAINTAAASTITLGASVQVTGALANTGRYYKDGYQFAVDQINKHGGVTVGHTHYKLALKVLDNQSNNNLAVRQYVQLLTQDKVNFLLGPFASSAVLATSSVAEKYDVPMIEGGGASDQIFSRGYKYVFGTLPVASKYFQSTIHMMKRLHPKPKTVALLYADDAFDSSVAKGTRHYLKRNGFDIVLDSRYSKNASDFSSLLSRIKTAKPDVVLLAGHETEALNFIRQAKSLNVSPGLYAFTVGVPTADFRHALGPDANFAFGMTSWLPSPKAKDAYFKNAADFAKAYEAHFGYQPDYHAASAVADVEAYVKAIEKAGTLNAKKVRNAIAHVDFNSLYGRIRFTRAGQIQLPETVIQVQHDQVVPIYGRKGFLHKAQYPMPGWNQR